MSRRRDVSADLAVNVDVIVVGGGGSGLAAAIEARSTGAEVVLLEKNPALGGTTARSIGSITAAGTPHQARVGITDSPDGHLRDLAAFSRHVGRPDNQALCRVLTSNVPATLQWLGDSGVEFLGPLEEPPHEKPRMHNVVPNSRSYIFHLERRARREGVHIVTRAHVKRLLSLDGCVRGVEYELPAGQLKSVHASRAVVLAAGDYAASADMKRDLISDAVARTDAVNPTSTGDGHRMALALGARIVNPDLFGGGARFIPPAQASWVSKLPPSRWLMRPITFALRTLPTAVLRRFVMGFLTTVMVPSRELYDAGAILVNRDGDRFCDESKSMIFDLAYQPSGMAYIIIDGTLARQFSAWPHFISTAPGIAFAYLEDYERNRPDLVVKASTPADLAQRLGIDADRFSTTIRHYNAGVAMSSQASIRGNRPELVTPPFYALGPVKNYINYTDGGLAVDTQLRVLNAADRPIPGLYAAGSTGQGGLLLKGHGHHLGWAFTSGRIAGRNAARFDRNVDPSAVDNAESVVDTSTSANT
jgi:succinate dehydrogenase/fumarate reductase flavoprotein subunit